MVGKDHEVHLPDFRIEEQYQVGARSGRLYSWGLDFLKIRDVHGFSKGNGVLAFILDTEDNPKTKYLSYDPYYSRRFTNEGPEVDSQSGHGVHVADTVQQVAPEAVIGLVKGLSNSGSGYSSWIANGIIWIADLQPKRGHEGFSKIVNLSLGSPFPSGLIRDAIEYAVKKGVHFVVAAGNGGGEVDYPGAYDELVITISALNRNGTLASFSDRGAAIDLASPGVGIVAEFRDGLAALSGTSMAAPHVTGLLALLLSYYRELEDAELFLKMAATDAGDIGEDNLFGAGVPIATAYFDDIEPPPPPPPPDGKTQLPVWAWILIAVALIALTLILAL